MINLSIMQIVGISCLILAGLITIVLIATYKSVWCSESPKELVKEPEPVKEVTEDLKEIIKKEIKKELSKQSA